jgi:uncharacterized membrane protein
MIAAPTSRLRLARALVHLHPAIVLMALDLLGLVVASYLAWTALMNQLPSCGPIHGCQEVALSPYSRINGVPVALGGVVLSITLFGLAFVWWRTGRFWALAGHYFLSLVGVLFEGWLTYAELFLIKAVCVWCAIYGLSLLARYLVALRVWLDRDRYVVPRIASG